VRGEPRRLQQHLAPGRRQPEQQFPETDDPPSHGFSGTGIGARVAAGIVVDFDSAANATLFTLRNVPVVWTGELTITDRAGCARQFPVIGSRTPITITPPNVTDPNVTVDRVGVRKKGLPEGVAWAYFLPVAAILLAAFLYSGWFSGTWAGEEPLDRDRDFAYAMPPNARPAPDGARVPYAMPGTSEGYAQPLLAAAAQLTGYGTIDDDPHLD
jgi:hypothetical protein